MSVHNQCGEQIRWAKSPRGDKFLPPLEFVGHHYILMDSDDEEGQKVASEVACYQIHNCDPDKMAAWQEYRDKVEALKRESAEVAERLPTNWEIARQRDQEATRARAEKEPCPKCKADVNEPCYNLAIWKRQRNKIATNMPHQERMTWL